MVMPGVEGHVAGMDDGGCSRCTDRRLGDFGKTCALSALSALSRSEDGRRWRSLLVREAWGRRRQRKSGRWLFAAALEWAVCGMVTVYRSKLGAFRVRHAGIFLGGWPVPFGAPGLPRRLITADMSSKLPVHPVYRPGCCGATASWPPFPLKRCLDRSTLPATPTTTPKPRPTLCCGRRARTRRMVVEELAQF